jgi:hypothetical protein
MIALPLRAHVSKSTVGAQNPGGRIVRIYGVTCQNPGGEFWQPMQKPVSFLATFASLAIHYLNIGTIHGHKLHRNTQNSTTIAPRSFANSLDFSANSQKPRRKTQGILEQKIVFD